MEITIKPTLGPSQSKIISKDDEFEGEGPNYHHINNNKWSKVNQEVQIFML